MQKRPVGVFIVAWVILLTNIVLLLSHNIFYAAAEQMRLGATFFYRLVTVIGAFPSQLPGIFWSLSTPKPIVNFVYLIWAVMMIACAVGILLRKNAMRLWFIVLNMVHIITALCAWIIVPILSGRKQPAVYILCAVLVSIGYLIYFSNKKTKDYFRSEKVWLNSDVKEERFLVIFIITIIALNIVYVIMPKTATLQAMGGSYYKGGVRFGKMHGQGMFVWFTGDKYEGQWRDGMMDGLGTFTWSNGDVYKGYFKNNKMHGKGIKTKTDGTSVEGICKNGQFVGEVLAKDPSGTVFRGAISPDGITQYAEEIEFPDGSKYKGELRNYMPQGQGTFFYKSGDIYKGEFKNGKKDGQGEYIWSDGKSYKGKFKYGEICGPGDIQITDQNGKRQKIHIESPSDYSELEID